MLRTVEGSLPPVLLLVTMRLFAVTLTLVQSKGLFLLVKCLNAIEKGVLSPHAV